MFKSIDVNNIFMVFHLSVVPCSLESNVTHEPTLNCNYTTQKVLTNSDYFDAETLENLIQELPKQQD